MDVRIHEVEQQSNRQHHVESNSILRIDTRIPLSSYPDPSPNPNPSPVALTLALSLALTLTLTLNLTLALTLTPTLTLHLQAAAPERHGAGCNRRLVSSSSSRVIARRAMYV